MNLHDWIDELCDVLDLDTEVDEGLLGDLARLSHDNVDAHAGPVTTYLLGYAAGIRSAGPAAVETLAARAQALAEQWDRPRTDGSADDDVPVDDLGLDDLEGVAGLDDLEDAR
ncbi:DUF6457 domain-containing protein [Nocardioides rubriscoriae]|uniref:DUF6457 domain-containing protein n=1 Tax=Nocardioides rubriscoriae TaxID=642762 RepID=UPI0011E04D9D|nr:DUF6457 domain-containing protein [Nocardioides rubriscoriae]